MLVVQWGACKARLWVNELPIWEYAIGEVVERRYNVPERDSSLARSAALEVWIPIGGRAYYGGLAVAYTPREQEVLVVQVPLSVGNGIPVQDSLAGKGEMPYTGLLPEYVDGVFRGLMQAEYISQLGSGTLQVRGALHGKIGSSLWLFEVLGSMLIQLLILETLPLSEAGLIELLQREIRLKRRLFEGRTA